MKTVSRFKTHNRVMAALEKPLKTGDKVLINYGSKKLGEIVSKVKFKKTFKYSVNVCVRFGVIETREYFAETLLILSE